MLTDFFRPSKDLPNEWKKGFLINSAGDRIPFAYNKIPASQLSRISMVSGVFMTKGQSMISTTCGLSFDHSSKFVLEDGFRYSFVSETSSDSENENNPFGIAGTPARRYVTLARIA